MLSRHFPLGVEEPQQFLLLLFTECSTDAHVADDRTGYAWGESLRRVVTAGALLLKYPITLIDVLLCRMGRCGRGYQIATNLFNYQPSGPLGWPVRDQPKSLLQISS
jgi:hypothetical protein